MAKGNRIMGNGKGVSAMTGGYDLIGGTKGSSVMSNKKFTSDTVGLDYGDIVGLQYDDIIGSTADGGDSMPGFRDRKGGDVMSNSRATSNMTGAEAVVAGALADETTRRRLNAAVNIDKRIYGLLKNPYNLLYWNAMQGTNAATFETAANKLLMQMAGDSGVASVVKSVAIADQQFGGLGLLQRAIVRRLQERKSAIGL